MKYPLLLILLSSSLAAFGQITITSQSLPDIGDVLEYRTFNYVGTDEEYLTSGSDISWTFDEFVFTGEEQEEYADISGAALQDSFPEANMIVELGFFTGAAVRTDSTIQVLGFDVIEAQQFLGEVRVNRLATPLTLRHTPLNYGDFSEGEFSIPVTFDAELIPGIDSFELPIPGATLDSIRVTTAIYRSEEVDSWGNLNVIGNDYDVLKVKTIDSTATTIEAGLGVFGQTIWFDATEFIGDAASFLGDNTSITTYKFLSADSKESILEFNQEIELDDLGNIVNFSVRGRMSIEVTSSVDDQLGYQAEFTLNPNPVTSGFCINGATSNNRGVVGIKIIDHLGRTLLTQLQQPLGSTLNVSDLQPGLYRVLIQHGSQSEVLSFIMQ